MAMGFRGPLSAGQRAREDAHDGEHTTARGVSDEMTTDKTKPMGANPGAETARTATAGPPAPGAMPPGQVFWLKVLVVGLGVLIIAAMIAIVARVIVLVSSDAPGPPPATPVSLTVPGGTTLRGASVDGERMILRLRRDGRDLVQIRRVGTGELIRQFELTPAPAKAD